MSTPSESLPNRWLGRVVFMMVCALVVGVFCWSAEPGFFESVSPRAADAYYNLLVQGFRSGHLNVNREAPTELAKLANPYDPAANASCVWDVRDMSYEMSYYQGKLYLYYGVTPALVLFWPYAALTGHYCSHKDAVVIFFALGFLIAAGLLYAIWQRFFAEVSAWVPAVGALALGLAGGALGPLATCDLHEVPHSCGFAFAMLALAAIWCALHKPKGRVWWTMLASLAYGLAVGSRPSLLPGIIILLLPVAHAWRSAKGPALPQRTGLLLIAAVVPAMLIGCGLMLYNVLRFGSPFEFGWHYQLTDIENNHARPFSLDYFWFNLKFYFLEPVGWGGHFPFLQVGRVPPVPPHYYSVGEPYCGLLLNYPMAWLALAAPLAWQMRPASEAPALRWFAAAVLLLFATCALTLCAFFSASSGYLSDFLPALMLLAATGIMGLERALSGRRVVRRWARLGWCLLVGYSVTFSILAGVKSHAQSNYIMGNSLSHQGREDEAFGHFERAVALDPESATFNAGLGRAYTKAGKLDYAIACFQKAVVIEPAGVEARYDLGLSLIQAGRLNEAAIHLGKAQELDPGFAETQDPAINNNFAWALATDSDPGKRNGTIAVMLAEAACRKTHYEQTVMVGTLGAAYAEAGRFEDAIATAQKACALAARVSDQKLLQKNRELLDLYRQHRPYRESAGALAPHQTE